MTDLMTPVVILLLFIVGAVAEVRQAKREKAVLEEAFTKHERKERN